MCAKLHLKTKAIELRRDGRTYSEILKEIPVAKSTLSLWFHEVKLATHQTQRITEKRIEGQKKGAQARRDQRIALQERIWMEAQGEIGTLSRRELWLVGIALYWAEGTKEKVWNPGHRVVFSNSDPRMIRAFLRWIQLFSEIQTDEIRFEIYIHESKRDAVSDVKLFWSKEINLPLSFFQKVYFKKNKLNTRRKNVGLLYNGLLRVNIPRSSILLRRIEGWVRGIDKCRIV